MLDDADYDEDGGGDGDVKDTFSNCTTSIIYADIVLIRVLLKDVNTNE